MDSYNPTNDPAIEAWWQKKDAELNPPTPTVAPTPAPNTLARPVPAAAPVPTVTPAPFDPELEVEGFDGRLTRAQLKKIREHEQGTDDRSYFEYSRAVGDRSLDALEGLEDKPFTQAQNLAQARLNFRRWASENNIEDSFDNGTEQKLLGTWADSLFPPKALTNRNGEPTGKMQRDARATQLMNALAGESRTRYWTQGVPDDAAFDAAVQKRAEDDPEFKKQLDASRRTPETPKAEAPKPTPEAGFWRRSADLGLETAAGLARGVVSIGDLGNRVLQKMGTGLDQKTVEGVYKGLDYLKEQGQSEAYTKESREFGEALAKVDASVILELGRALARGDKAAADRLADQSGIGEAYRKAGKTVVLGTILGGVAEFASPMGAGGLAARAGAKALGAGANVLTRSGQAGAIAGATLAPTAATMTEVGNEVRQKTGDDTKADAASAMASPAGAMVAGANLVGAVAGPAAGLARMLPGKLAPTAASGLTERVIAGAAAGAAQGGGAVAGGNIARAEAGVAPQNLSGPAIMGGVMGGVFGATPAGKEPVRASRSDAEPKVTSANPEEAAVAAVKSALGDPPQLLLPAPDTPRSPRFESTGPTIITPPPAPDRGAASVLNDPRAAAPRDMLALPSPETVARQEPRASAAETPSRQDVLQRTSDFLAEQATARRRNAEFDRAVEQRGQDSARQAAASAEQARASNVDAEATQARIDKAKFYERRGDRPATVIDEPTAAKAKAEYDALAQRVGARIEMVSDKSQLPPEVAAQFTDGTKAATYKDADGRTVIAVDRSMHGSEADLQQTLNHEIVAHATLPKLLGEDAYTRVLNHVATARETDPVVAATYKEVAAKYPGADPAGLAGEVLARINDGAELPQGGAAMRALDAVARGLEAVGFKSKAGLRAQEAASLLKAITGAQDNIEALTQVRVATAPVGSVSARQRVERSGKAINYSNFRNWITTFFNEKMPIYDVAEAARQHGAEDNRLHDVTVQQSIARMHAVGDANNKFIQPVFDAIDKVARSTGVSSDKLAPMFDTLALAKHGLERNDRTYNLFTKLSDRLETLRNGLLADLWAGLRTSDSVHAELRREIDAEKGGAARAEWRGSGATDAQIREAQAYVARDPVLQRLETEVWPLYRAMMDKKTEVDLKAGLLSREELASYGFNNYVPMRGGDVGSGANAFVRKGVGSGYVPDKSAHGRGDLGVPSNILGEGAALTREAAALASTNRVKQELASIIERTGLFGEVLDLKQEGKPYLDATGEWKYDVPKDLHKDGYRNVFAYVDENGQRRFIRTEGKELSAALDKMENPPTLGKGFRGLQESTSMLGRTFTVLNPSFWIPAFSRDIQGNTARLATNPERFGLTRTQGLSAAAAFAANAAKNLVSPTVIKYAYSNHTNRLAMIEGLKKTDPEFAHYLENYAIDFKDQFAVARGSGERNAFERLADTAAGQRVSTWMEKLVAQQEVFELSHRYGFYKALRAQGLDQLSAGRRTIELTDFSQRSAMSRILNTVFPFSNTVTAGAQRSISGLFREGIPVRYERMPDGSLTPYTDVSALLKGFNKTHAAAHIALAYIAGSTALSMMDSMKDEHGVPLAKKVSAGALSRGFLGAGADGKVYRTPFSDTEAGFFHAIGSLLAGLTYGTVSNEEFTINVVNAADRMFAPALKPRAEFSDAPNQNIEDALKIKLLGATPALVRPLAENAFNLNFAGGTLDNRGQTRFAAGGPLELKGLSATRDSTAPEYKAIANVLRGGQAGAGGFLDVSGDSVRNAMLTYLGYPMRLLDKSWTNRERALRRGESPDNAVTDALSEIFMRQETSPNGYYVRESQAATAPFESMRREFWQATQDDRASGSARKTTTAAEARAAGLTRAGSWTEGEKQATFLRQNPAFSEYLQWKKDQNNENMRDSRTPQGGKSQQSKIARAQGDAEQVKSLNAGRDDKAARNIDYLKNLWAAHAAWQEAGSDPKKWAEIRARFPRAE